MKLQGSLLDLDQVSTVVKEDVHADVQVGSRSDGCDRSILRF